MAAQADNKAVAFSEKVFERLLAAYPKAHREEYGAAMAQLFRDQCRDAWSESRGWGLAKLWLRVLPDVIGTSLSEHLEAIKERKFMLNQISTLFRSAHYFKFSTVFTAVFLLVVITVTAITFILPEAFVSTARVSLVRDETATKERRGLQRSDDFDPYYFQTQFEILKSEVVLGRVVEKLNLNEQWGNKFHAGKKLSTTEAIETLRHLIDPRPVRNTSLIEIRAYSDKPDDAALIANTVSEVYIDFYHNVTLKQIGPGTIENRHVEIVEKAVANSIPVRPNKPMSIIVGIFLGTLLGLIAGGGVAGISFLSRRNSPPKIAS